MNAVCNKFSHSVNYKYAICGADAIDKVGDPFPDQTYQICKDADAVLFSAVGDPKFDNDPKAKVRPEQGLLAMRKKLGLFANIRPVETFKSLLYKSPLKEEIIKDADFLEEKAEEVAMQYGRDVDAIVCASDLMALGAQSAMKELHLEKPICGFDGISLMGYVGQGIYTIGQNFSQISAIAMEELHRLMMDEKGQIIEVEYSLIRN